MIPNILYNTVSYLTSLGALRVFSFVANVNAGEWTEADW